MRERVLELALVQVRVPERALVRAQVPERVLVTMATAATAMTAAMVTAMATAAMAMAMATNKPARYQTYTNNPAWAAVVILRQRPIFCLPTALSRRRRL